LTADDPNITVRHVRGRHPHVVVLDGRVSLKDSATLLKIMHDRYVFLCVDDAYARRQRTKVLRMEDRGVIVLRFKGAGGTIALRDVLREVYKYGIGSILVEGGSHVFAAFRDEDLADEISVFVAPFTLGAGTQVYASPRARAARKFRASETSVQVVGRDVLFNTRYA
jgi:riboflavin biosynthesis pyrimidine reductase